MLLQEVQQAIDQLPVEERLILLGTIAQSIQRDLQPQSTVDKRVVIDQLRGCLKQPGKPTPTDAEVELMREEQLVEKYLK
jgi:hypothetical protein